MNRTLVRDGALALLALLRLLAHLRRRSRLDALGSPVAAVVGVAGALGIEAFLLRHPERTEELWSRPVVRIGSLVGVVAGGRALARRAGAWTAAALCWGLLTYLGLVVVVLTGRENPVAGLSSVGPGSTVPNGTSDSTHDQPSGG